MVVVPIGTARFRVGLSLGGVGSSFGSSGHVMFLGLALTLYCPSVTVESHWEWGIMWGVVEMSCVLWIFLW